MAREAAQAAVPNAAAVARAAYAARPLKGKRAENRIAERVVRGILALCAFVSVLTTVGIVLVLLFETVAFFRVIRPWDFFTGTTWSPLIKPASYGVLPLIAGTLQIAIAAMAVAVPIGVATAIYLSMYARPGIRAIVKPMLEILAGIPTVVYGYFALTFVSPEIVHRLFPETGVFNALSAGVVVGIMVVPMVSSLSEDAIQAVPKDLRDGGFALGATKFEVSTRVMVPAALSGISASFILAFSRAIGETMIVVLAAGATPNFTMNPLESIQTMTAYIAQVSQGDVPRGTIEYQTLFAVGFTLFLFTLLMNVLSALLVRRFREEYE